MKWKMKMKQKLILKWITFKVGSLCGIEPQFLINEGLTIRLQRFNQLRKHYQLLKVTFKVLFCFIFHFNKKNFLLVIMFRIECIENEMMVCGWTQSDVKRWREKWPYKVALFPYKASKNESGLPGISKLFW